MVAPLQPDESELRCTTHGAGGMAGAPLQQPDEREICHAVARLQITHGKIAASRCGVCWLTRAFCICDELAPMRIERPAGASGRVNVLLAIHYKEFGSASNTAKLLPLCLDGCDSLVYPTEAPALNARLGAGPVLLLWPGEGSEPASAHRHLLEASARGDGPPVTLLVIDGTWSKARSMARAVHPSIPRVHVNMAAVAGGSSLFAVRRKQPREDRVCTVRALLDRKHTSSLNKYIHIYIYVYVSIFLYISIRLSIFLFIYPFIYTCMMFT